MLTAFSLRLLALMAMLTDHVGLALFPGIPALRAVGRVSFVLYCFLLTEGFVYTRSRRAYLGRLVLFAVLSEVPFDLFLFAQVFQPLEQNVFFSLALALCALQAIEYGTPRQPMLTAAALLGLCLAALLMRVSYAWLGILLCMCFYAYRENPLRRAVSVMAVEALYAATLFMGGESLSWSLMQLFSLGALLPIALYNGKRGNRALRGVFYAAYPLSLAVLYVIRTARILPPYLGIF